MLHCPGCDGDISDVIGCPGVTCPTCAEKDAEIARLTALVDGMREEINVLTEQLARKVEARFI